MYSIINSDLLVISWWSNCLGLACLHNLVQHTSNRAIYLIQVGKQEDQKTLFRYYMPRQIIELPYEAQLPSEDWCVRETAARKLLKNHSGVWFVDHDLLFEKNIDTWLQNMDQRFCESNICLSHCTLNSMHSVTNPAFWISPARMPEETPCFAPQSFPNYSISQARFASTASSEFIVPNRDTLVSASLFLRQLGYVYEFPLQKRENLNGEEIFPNHEHIGGLAVLAWRDFPNHLRDWVATCVEKFRRFYQSCPPEWRSIENPEITRRIYDLTNDSV